MHNTYYNFDNAGRMTQRLETEGPPYFTYDAVGNRIKMQEGSGTTYFAYDAINRLTSEEKI